MKVTKVNISSEKIDKRRTKSYGRMVKGFLTTDTLKDERLYPRLRYAEEILKDSDLPVGYLHLDCHAGRDWCDHTTNNDCYSFRFKMDADKPSQIASEEDAEILGHEVASIVTEVLEAADNKCAVDDRIAKLSKNATRISEWIGETAVERALEAVRYKQRKAALVAELEEEIGIQHTRLLVGSEIEDDIEESDGDFEAVEIEIARRYSKRYAKTHGRGFMRATPGEITKEEVAEHLELQKKKESAA